MRRPAETILLALAIGLGPIVVPCVLTSPCAAQTTGGFVLRSPQTTLYRLIPATGSVPLIYDPAKVEDREQLRLRAEAREYAHQMASLAHRSFKNARAKEARSKGLVELTEFTDAAALRPMWDVLGGEEADVILGVLDHFATRGEAGQAALVYAAIHTDDKAVRHEAVRRMTSPISDEALCEIDTGLRDSRHAIANAAGFVAGALNAVQAIPLLIFAQATEDRVAQTGDLAWIVIGTQTTYVANLIPVVGGNAGAFQPVLGVVNEGTLLRVMDAVAITYRIDIHNSLVAMTSSEWGKPTDSFGYNMKEWWTWFNQTLVPQKEEEARLARLLEAKE